MFQNITNADNHTFVLKWKTLLSPLAGPTVHGTLRLEPRGDLTIPVLVPQAEHGAPSRLHLFVLIVTILLSSSQASVYYNSAFIDILLFSLFGQISIKYNYIIIWCICALLFIIVYTLNASCYFLLYYIHPEFNLVTAIERMIACLMSFHPMSLANFTDFHS